MRKLLGVVAAVALGSAAHAQDYQAKTQGSFTLNTRVSLVAPQGDDPITTIAGAASGLRAHVGDDVMPTVGLTYFLTDNIAVEAIAGTTRHTISAKGPGVDLKVKETWVLPPVVTLQYHFAPAARVSPYVGAGVNYMLFYGGSNKNGFNLKVKDGFGTALQAGVDIAAKGPWTFNIDAKKVFFDTTAIDRTQGIKSKVTLDPWVISAGFGYRF